MNKKKNIEKEIDETYNKIKNLEIQGAQDISIESLKVLKKYAQQIGFSQDFTEAADKLKNARPTGVSAHNCIEYIKNKSSIEAIDTALKYLETARNKAAKNAAEIIEDGSTVMTHCHSKAVVSALKVAKKDGKDIKVFVTETRPRLQGLKTAEELIANDIPIYYIVDSAAGLFMWSADVALVGIDSVKTIGVLNKIGTYPMALAANEDPETDFYFVGTMDKFDYDDFSKIEERKPEEIIDKNKLNKPNVVIENPAFDLTPWGCIDGIITEKGIHNKSEVIDTLSKKFHIY